MKLIVLLLLASLVYANDFYYEYGQKVEVSQSTNKRSNDTVKYYQKQNGTVMGIKKDEILTQCKAGVDCAKVLAKYDFASISKLSTTIFLVKLTPTQDVFNYSQILHNDSDIAFAHPNFVKERKGR